MEDFYITIFDKLFSKEPNRILYFENLREFEEFFFSCSKKKFYLIKENGKKKTDAFLISPAIAKENSDSRKAENAIGWSRWCCLDIDDLQNYTRESFLEKLKTFGYYFICYSTPSSRKYNVKMRIVFIFDREVPLKETKQVWYALSKLLDNVIDKQTKDVFRILYSPGEYEKAYNFILKNDGSPINIDNLLKQYPYIENTPILINPFLDNRYLDFIKDKYGQEIEYSWTCVDDCPFVGKRSLEEYRRISLSDNTGRYGKMFSLLVSICIRAKSKKYYSLTEYDLFKLVSEIDNSFIQRHGIKTITDQIKGAMDYASKK